MSDTTQRFDRLPRMGTSTDDRPSRAAVVDYWAERFAIPPSTFEEYTFWERGAGKIWAFRGDLPSPVRVQGLGMFVLRTGGEHWKPTTNAVQRFGTVARRNVLELDLPQACAFLRGEDQPVSWAGEWGYLIVTRSIAGASAPIGVGLYLDGELRSQVPKGRRRSL